MAWGCHLNRQVHRSQPTRVLWICPRTNCQQHGCCLKCACDHAAHKRRGAVVVIGVGTELGLVPAVAQAETAEPNAQRAQDRRRQLVVHVCAQGDEGRNNICCASPMEQGLVESQVHFLLWGVGQQCFHGFNGACKARYPEGCSIQDVACLGITASCNQSPNALHVIGETGPVKGCCTKSIAEGKVCSPAHEDTEGIVVGQVGAHVEQMRLLPEGTGWLRILNSVVDVCPHLQKCTDQQWAAVQSGKTNGCPAFSGAMMHGLKSVLVHESFRCKVGGII